MNIPFAQSVVAVTGGAGSVGRTILKKLGASQAGLIRVIDNNEGALFELENDYRDHENVEFYCCDITDDSELTRCFSGVDYVFHLAALKHVPLCERNPFSAVNVNIRGTEAVIRAAVQAGVRRVLFTSSDKAVNPTNVMGTSKLMGERLFTAASMMGGDRFNARPVFASTRFGNVAGTRGSVIPLFADQIAKGGPVTLTDRRMTRFVMTQERAAELVIDSIDQAVGGEVFITKMPALRIMDLAEVMIEMLAPAFGHCPEKIDILTVGGRPGEKLWEELSTDEESNRIFEGEEYLVVEPAEAQITHEEATVRYPSLSLKSSSTIYHSEKVNKMTRADIANFLGQPDVLPVHVNDRLRHAAAPAGLSI